MVFLYTRLRLFKKLTILSYPTFTCGSQPSSASDIDFEHVNKSEIGVRYPMVQSFMKSRRLFPCHIKCAVGGSKEQHLQNFQRIDLLIERI